MHSFYSDLKATRTLQGSSVAGTLCFAGAGGALGEFVLYADGTRRVAATLRTALGECLLLWGRCSGEMTEIWSSVWFAVAVVSGQR